MDSDAFVELLTEHQGRLYAYVLALVGRPDDANDVLQETNVVLWRKWKEYEEGTNFRAWTFRVAHFQVMAFRQRCARDRLLFDDDLILTLACEAKRDDESFAARADTLARCIEKLTPKQKTLLRLRYGAEESLAGIAQAQSKSVASIAQALYRIRLKLIACVRHSTEGVVETRRVPQ